MKKRKITVKDLVVDNVYSRAITTATLVLHDIVLNTKIFDECAKYREKSRFEYVQRWLMVTRRVLAQNGAQVHVYPEQQDYVFKFAANVTMTIFEIDPIFALLKGMRLSFVDPRNLFDLVRDFMVSGILQFDEIYHVDHPPVRVDVPPLN